MTKKIAILASIAVSLCVRAETGAYKAVVDKLQALEKENPDLVSVFSIGDNEDGVPIYAARLSLTPSKADPAKVGHIVVSTHHGNETAAPVLAMNLLTTLISQYRSPLLYKTKLSTTEWVILPVLNISGFNRKVREEYRTDSNRNYPGPCHSGTPTLKSVQRLIDHLTTRIYSASATLHGYLGSLTYPWGFSTTNVRTLDDNQYAKLTKDAAAINGYQYGTSTDIVYPVDGAYEDYVYWKHGIWSWLVELRTGASADVTATTQSVLALFEGVDSSPSTSNGLSGRCSGTYAIDRHDE